VAFKDKLFPTLDSEKLCLWALGYRYDIFFPGWWPFILISYELKSSQTSFFRPFLHFKEPHKAPPFYLSQLYFLYFQKSSYTQNYAEALAKECTEVFAEREVPPTAGNFGSRASRTKNQRIVEEHLGAV
jgi:hypothetical protein